MSNDPVHERTIHTDSGVEDVDDERQQTEPMLIQVEQADEGPENDQTPADFSEDENDPAAAALHKQALLEWVTVADFTQEISLTKVASHKFKLDEAEINALIGTEGILKICKT